MTGTGILVLELLFLSAITFSYLQRRNAVTGEPLVQLWTPVRQMALALLQAIRQASWWTALHLPGRKLSGKPV